MKTFVGIDISKLTFDSAVLTGDKLHHRKFSNKESGFSEFLAWVRKLAGESELNFCMESTGCYHLELALWLVDQHLWVSVENPRRIKHFAIAENLRNKTDKVDAGSIARYAKAMAPSEWNLKDPILRELDSLRTRIRQLNRTIQAENSRLENRSLGGFLKAQILESIALNQRLLKEVQERIQELMSASPKATSIYKAVTQLNGAGPEVGLLVCTLDVKSFHTAQAVPAYFGLNPKQHQSGQFAGRTRISKMGDAAGRSTLVSAAYAAARFNPELRAFFQKLKARGLKPKQAIAAVARKLLMLAWAIARNTLQNKPVYYPGGIKKSRNAKIYCPTT